LTQNPFFWEYEINGRCLILYYHTDIDPRAIPVATLVVGRDKRQNIVGDPDNFLRYDPTKTNLDGVFNRMAVILGLTPADISNLLEIKNGFFIVDGNKPSNMFL